MNKRLLDKMPATPDLNRERLDQLKVLMPDLFTNDGTLDPDELKRLIDPDSVAESERFEFRWFGKANAKRNAFTPTLASLEVDKERSVNPDLANGNAIIEGENLEVLKCLLTSYRNQVKCIYIDPPYNTGNDFVYSDSWDEKRESYWEHVGVTENGVKVDTNTRADGRFHSNWLNMIYPRLLLARNLLSDDGLILISMDDSEIQNLHKICDEVFGEEMFLGCFIWHRRQQSDSRNYSRISPDHEYILCYGRSENSRFAGESIDVSKYKNPDNDERGDWASIDLSGLATATQRPNLHYDIIDPDTGIAYPPNPNRGWSKSKAVVDEMIKEGRILFPKKPSGRPREKKFLSDLKSDVTGFSTILKSKVVGFTTNGTREVSDLLEGKYFDFAKPTTLLSQLLRQSTVPGDIILDFFAGSGPVGQATMTLNSKDSGNRKFILVQIPETNPVDSEAYKAGFRKISEITIERNKRVVQRFD